MAAATPTPSLGRAPRATPLMEESTAVTAGDLAGGLAVQPQAHAEEILPTFTPCRPNNPGRSGEESPRMKPRSLLTRS